MPEKQCPFCPVEPDAHAIVYEDEICLVFSSDPRIMFGHTITAPKKHIAAVDDLPEDELIHIVKIAFQYKRKLIAKFSKIYNQQAGCDLSTHDRPFMPLTRLTVPSHAHIHLRPRLWKDDYYERVQKYETDVFADLTAEEREKFRKLFEEQ